MTLQIENQPQVTFLCSVVDQSHGAAKIALSTAEAEYAALSGAAQECLWLRQLEVELGCPPEGPTLIFEDNQSTIAMAKNPQFHGRAKHIDIRHHFFREQVANGTIKLDYCSTTDMTADIITKGLSIVESRNV